LDVGCGCGFYHNLCRSEFPEISYKGIDYAPQAIELAIENFPGGNFEIKNILDLDSEYVSAFDLVHLGALLDVLPNGDEVLEFLLSLQPQKILLGRVRFTDGPSFFREYIAYSDVNTYEYYHNRENFLSVISKNNYSLLEDGGSLLLERLEEINKK
jgi:trans-aconitate methyltransferase